MIIYLFSRYLLFIKYSMKKSDDIKRMMQDTGYTELILSFDDFLKY